LHGSPDDTGRVSRTLLYAVGDPNNTQTITIETNSSIVHAPYALPTRNRRTGRTPTVIIFNVTLSCVTAGADIHYQIESLDRDDVPTEPSQSLPGAWTTYAGPFSISVHLRQIKRVWMFATKIGITNSPQLIRTIKVDTTPHNYGNQILLKSSVFTPLLPANLFCNIGVTSKMSQSQLVLLVEDDANDAFVAKRALHDSGVFNHVVHLPDGEEAIKYLNGDPPYHDRNSHPQPGLVLLDLKMPKLTGFDVLTWLQLHPQLTSEIPVIVLTGSIHPEDMKRAQKLGAVGFEVKPIEFSKLVEIAKKISKSHLSTRNSPQPGSSSSQ